jgi:hypothetical protein
MAGLRGVLHAAHTNQTGRTTAVNWVAACAKWIISVLGIYAFSRSTYRILLIFCRVGGVVSETSFKFFIQFVVYTCVYCTFTLIVSAYFTAEIRRQVSTVTGSLGSPVPMLTFSRPEEQILIGAFALDCK